MNLKPLIFGLILFASMSCQDALREEDPETIKKIDTLYYGLRDPELAERAVDVDLSAFTSMNPLHDELERIACNDSIPRIQLFNGEEYKFIYPIIHCPQHYECIRARSRNYIIIHNDSIVDPRRESKTLPLNQLKNELVQNLENYGENPDLAENPDVVVVILQYDSLDVRRVHRVLDELTDIYESISDTTDVSIGFSYTVDIPTPPPPPTSN